jgi:hypothetical protein
VEIPSGPINSETLQHSSKTLMHSGKSGNFGKFIKFSLNESEDENRIK